MICPCISHFSVTALTSQGKILNILSTKKNSLLK
jgi:hypothetical protein